MSGIENITDDLYISSSSISRDSTLHSISKGFSVRKLRTNVVLTYLYLLTLVVITFNLVADTFQFGIQLTTNGLDQLEELTVIYSSPKSL